MIPSDGPTSKVPLHGDSWRQWCGPRRRPVPEFVWRTWCTRYGDHEGLLLLDSSTGDLPDLAVVDADDPAVFAWVESTFGRTPLTVESGRPGGGRHYYYTVPRGEVVHSRNGQIGPEWSWRMDSRGCWRTPIDVKSHRAYVVAPGSRHRTGVAYSSSMSVEGFFHVC